MNNKPLIKMFKTRNQYYFFDANKNEIVDVNKEQYEALEKYMNTGSQEYINSKELNILVEQGYLSTNRVKEISSPYNDLLEYYLKNNVEMLNLQLTQQCNFRCEYCVYSGSYMNRKHSSKRMSKEIALKAIDFAIDHSKGNKKLYINFYGGEPLLEFELIKTCVKYVKKKYEGKEIYFYMTTNGYLINEEIMDFLYKNNIWITISLDGPEEIHDSHRKLALNNNGTFKKVYENIVNLTEKYSDYMEKIKFSVVVDGTNNFYTIENFFKTDKVAKNIDLIVSPISSDNAKVPVVVSEEFHVDRQYEVFRELYYSLKKYDSKRSNSKLVDGIYQQILKIHEGLIPQNKLPEKSHPGGPCIAGTKRLFVSTDGSFYPCEKCSESSDIMRIGDIDNGFNEEKVKKIINIGQVGEKSCKNCWAFFFCSMCAVTIDTCEKDFSVEKKSLACDLVKKEIEDKFKTYCVLREFGHEFKDINMEKYLFEYYKDGKDEQ